MKFRFSGVISKKLKSRVLLESLNFLSGNKSASVSLFSFDSAGQKSHLRLTTFLRLIPTTNGKIYKLKENNRAKSNTEQLGLKSTTLSVLQGC